MASKPPDLRLDVGPSFVSQFKTIPSFNLEDASLLDMPAEIIIYIFQFFEDSALRSALRVCRRLCELAISVTMSRHQIQGSDPAEFMLSNTGPSTILGEALYVAPFLPPLNRISCQFPDHPNSESVHREIKILQGIILKLSHLEEFEIDLSKIGSLINSLTMSLRFLAHYRMWWGRLLIPLLSVIVEMTTTVTIRYDKRSSHVPQYDWTRPSLATFLRHLGTTVKAVLACTKRATYHVPEPDSTLISRRPGPTVVQIMKIHAAMLLHFPFLPWTIDTLNTSSITNLSFDNIDLGSTTWHLVLQSLTLPTLLELSFEYVAITLSDFSRFLSRHPLITRLHLSRPAQTPAEIEAESPLRPFNRRILPRLTTLSLSPSLEHFKVFLSRRHSLPSLRNLFLIKDISSGDVFALEDIDPALSTISHRLDTINLSFKLNIDCNTSQWLSTRTTLDSCASSALLASVAHMEIKADLVYLEHGVWVRLPNWLTLFRALREVVFVDFEYSASSQGPSQGDRLTFVSSLSKTCRGVETIGFNEEVHTIASWLMKS